MAYPLGTERGRSDPFDGMREFAIEDPDGHILTFAEKVAG